MDAAGRHWASLMLSPCNGIKKKREKTNTKCSHLPKFFLIYITALPSPILNETGEVSLFQSIDKRLNVIETGKQLLTYHFAATGPQILSRRPVF